MLVAVGVVLIAAGLLLAFFVNTALGVLLIVLGVLAIALSFTSFGAWGPRRTVVVERDRPVSREVVREPPVEREVVRDRPVVREREIIQERDEPL